MWPLKKALSGSTTPRTRAPITLDDPALFRDPYALYARLRAAGPVAEVHPGGYLLLSHRDVSAALANPDLGNAPSRFSALSKRFRETRVSADLAANILPFLDPPEHTAPRRALAKAFGARFKALGPQLEPIAARMVADLPPGETEVISRLSSPFAIRVMTRFLGLADETGADLKPYTESFFRLFAPLSDPVVMERVNADLAGFRTYLGARMAAGEVAAEGLLAQAGDLSPEALIDNAILLFADGIENIERGTATILRVLAREGALGRAPLKPLIPEALRLETPAQVIARVVRQETDVAGRRLAPGTPVFLGLGAANRDPSAFEDAERFRPGRVEEGLTFGRGRHSCMGSVLAAAQFEALIGALTARGIDVPDQKVRYLPRAGHLWPESLIITLA